MCGGEGQLIVVVVVWELNMCVCVSVVICTQPSPLSEWKPLGTRRRRYSNIIYTDRVGLSPSCPKRISCSGGGGSWKRLLTEYVVTKSKQTVQQTIRTMSQDGRWCTHFYYNVVGTDIINIILNRRRPSSAGFGGSWCRRCLSESFLRGTGPERCLAGKFNNNNNNILIVIRGVIILL